MSDDNRLPVVTFYRATRPQAPRYAKLPHNVGMMECASCRGLMLPDREANRKAHRKWHAKIGPLRTSTLVTEDGRRRPYQACVEVAELGGHYELVPECRHCSEDVCPCTPCQEQHVVECDQWRQVWELYDRGRIPEADALSCAIMANRPKTYRTRESLYEESRD